MRMMLIIPVFCLCLQQGLCTEPAVIPEQGAAAVQEQLITNGNGQISKTVPPPKVEVYSEKGMFGLKNGENIITKPVYKKMIRLGKTSWIVLYKSKYGLLSQDGDFLIQPKYRNADRFAGKLAKFGNGNDYGLYDETGKTIIPPEYSSIDMLYGNMLLTCKNYKYGISDMNGNILLENEFDDIYMPKPNVMIVQYNGNRCTIERISEKEITLPANINKISEDKDFKMTNIMVNTGVVSGYSVITLTDYVLKLLSSISPAYEATIDELMYSQGAETISILVKLTWLPKFPITYLKNYYKSVRHPNNGPLAGTRNSLKKQIR
ncbi:MAG: WG repeat-containing protein [Candidatus Gastranaerophilales bacterium]|nr:WG repeat-containing protein [Candidatus Gastranaerophilales bacterium]